MINNIRFLFIYLFLFISYLYFFYFYLLPKFLFHVPLLKSYKIEALSNLLDCVQPS